MIYSYRARQDFSPAVDNLCSEMITLIRDEKFKRQKRYSTLTWLAQTKNSHMQFISLLIMEIKKLSKGEKSIHSVNLKYKLMYGLLKTINRCKNSNFLFEAFIQIVARDSSISTESGAIIYGCAQYDKGLYAELIDKYWKPCLAVDLCVKYLETKSQVVDFILTSLDANVR